MAVFRFVMFEWKSRVVGMQLICAVMSYLKSLTITAKLYLWCCMFGAGFRSIFGCRQLLLCLFYSNCRKVFAYAIYYALLVNEVSIMDSRHTKISQHTSLYMKATLNRLEKALHFLQPMADTLVTWKQILIICATFISIVVFWNEFSQ